jgi:hypothetical protein
MLLNTALLIASILFGIRWNNKKISELKKPLPYIVYEMVEEVFFLFKITKRLKRE